MEMLFLCFLYFIFQENVFVKLVVLLTLNVCPFICKPLFFSLNVSATLLHHSFDANFVTSFLISFTSQNKLTTLKNLFLPLLLSISVFHNVK